MTNFELESIIILNSFIDEFPLYVWLYFEEFVLAVRSIIQVLVLSFLSDHPFNQIILEISSLLENENHYPRNDHPRELFKFTHSMHQTKHHLSDFHYHFCIITCHFAFLI